MVSVLHPRKKLWCLHGNLLKVLGIVFGVVAYNVPFISSDDSCFSSDEGISNCK